METKTDRIEKQILLRAPVERVWRAVSDAAEFGSWFGMELDGPFVPGARITGRSTPTTVDPVVAEMQEGHRGAPVTLVVEKMEPMCEFAYRWHPFALDPGVDYSKEPMTLVTFTLEPAEGGTLVTIVESGFDDIPLARRADAFEANDGGWAAMTHVLEKYVAQGQ
jgi:uncharacterized protein YndB with AHSA1/START domain